MNSATRIMPITEHEENESFFRERIRLWKTEEQDRLIIEKEIQRRLVVMFNTGYMEYALKKIRDVISEFRKDKYITDLYQGTIKLYQSMSAIFEQHELLNRLLEK